MTILLLNSWRNTACEELHSLEQSLVDNPELRRNVQALAHRLQSSQQQLSDRPNQDLQDAEQMVQIRRNAKAIGILSEEEAAEQAATMVIHKIGLGLGDRESPEAKDANGPLVEYSENHTVEEQNA